MKISTARNLATLLTTAFMCAIAVGNPLICKAAEYSEAQEIVSDEAYTETETSDKEETAQAEVDAETVVGTETSEENESTEEQDETVSSGDVASEDTPTDTGDSLSMDEMTGLLNASNEELTNIFDILTFIAGVMIFFVVVILCKYSYKFFNMFF